MSITSVAEANEHGKPETMVGLTLNQVNFGSNRPELAAYLLSEPAPNRWPPLRLTEQAFSGAAVTPAIDQASLEADSFLSAYKSRQLSITRSIRRSSPDRYLWCGGRGHPTPIGYAARGNRLDVP
ncbi:hypothetical protein EN918_27815, partial [Mesorhizobium sp. M7A.F.Ca.CA.004.05.1.1]